VPTHFPLDQPISFDASASDLAAFTWARDHICADFLLPNDENRLLRVEFDATCIVRLLDDMTLSTEEGAGAGLVAEHFAYRVEGARFADSQSAVWKDVHSPVIHYRFVTGWTCLDVLSRGVPKLTVVNAPSHLRL
jgi:hypothetical protein